MTTNLSTASDQSIDAWRANPHDTEHLTIFGIVAILFFGVLAAWLYAPSLEGRGLAGYVPLHSFLETVSIATCVLVFAVGWHSHGDERKRNIVMLAVAFLCVALLDFLHTMSYAGMPDFVTPSGPEKAINFWLAARTVAFVALLAVALQPPRAAITKAAALGALVGGLIIVVFVAWIGLYHADRLPDTFVPGVGLTPFKIGYEYVLVAIGVMAATLWYRAARDRQTVDHTARAPFATINLFAATAIMAMSEFFFTLYADVTDLFNLLGHVYRVIAALFIYRGIVVSNIQAPFHALALARDSLHSERQRFEQMIDSAMDAIIGVDGEGRVVSFNPGAEAVFGCPAGAAVGAPLDRFIPARFRAEHRHHLARFAATGEGSRRMGGDRVVTGLRANGAEFPLDASISHVTVDGKSLYTVILRDITQRKRDEARLKESEEQLRLFIEHAPAAVAMLDQEMRYLAVSRRWMRDYSLAEPIVGRSHYEVFPEIPERWREIHRRCLAGAEATDEERFERADGTVMWLRWEIQPWHTGPGEIGGIIMFTEDTTERRRADALLRETQQRLQSILGSIRDMVWSTSLDGATLHYLSPAAEDIYGRPQAELTANPSLWRDAVLPEDRGELERGLRTLGSTGAFEIEYRILRPDGETRWLNVRGWTVTDASGTPLRIDGVASDITGRKRDHQALRELGVAMETLREAERKRIAQELHDDLGQQLVAVKMDTAALRRATDLAQVHELTANLEGLANGAIASTRRLIADLRPVALDDFGLVAALEHLTNSVANRHGLQVDFRAVDDALELEDRCATQIYRIVQESLNNIAKHAQAARVIVSVERDCDRLVVSITDDGRGMNEADQRKARSYGLLGMRERAYALGGELNIASTTGAGTRIEVRIPLAGA